MSDTPFHPVADLFPRMSDAALNELAADIKANGLREPIWMHDGQIIDGRNRYTACTKAGVKPSFREWDGKGDLTTFVVSLNLHRRHLNESQRAMVAAKIATRPHGVSRVKQSPSTNLQMVQPTVEDAAKLLNVSGSGVHAAKRVRARAAAEVVKAVEDGEISIHLAEKVIDLPKAEQVAAVKREQLFKGKRNHRPATRQTETPMSSTSTTIKIAINTESPEEAASALLAALDTVFLEKLIAEMSGVIARRKAAQLRGMGPSRKD